MLVNDTNFVTPSFNEVKPENNINLISPLNFLRTAQNNSPIEKSVESTFDWKKDFDSFIQTVPKKYDLTTSLEVLGSNCDSAKSVQTYHQIQYQRQSG